MTTLRLALSELKRMTSGRLPKIAIAALTLVPLLYGALYLYANWDPYSNLHNVKAAIVNLDQGSTKDGKDLAVGDDVTTELMEDGTFGWNQVSTEAEAEAGVASGDYAFAMTIPADFSANLASPGDFEAAKQGILKLTTNDANNYMVGTFADKLAGQVHNTVAAEVGTQTADALLTGFTEIHTSMSKAADGAGKLHTGTVKLSDGVTTLADGVNTLDDGAGKLDAGAADLSQGANTLHDGTSSLLAGQKKLATGANSLAAGADTLADGTKELNAGLAELKSKTSALPAKTQQLNDGAQKASDASVQLADGAAEVAAGNKALDDKVTQAAETLTALEKDANTRIDSATEALNTRLDQLVTEGILTSEQAKTLRTDVTNAAKSSGVSEQVADTKKQLTTAQSQISALADGSAKVAAGAKQLSGGLSTLADGTETLAGAMPALKTGIGDAAAGASALNTGAQKLSDGADTLADGEADALAGTKKLNSGASTLAAGTTTLHEGTGSLLAGVGDLGDGVGELGDGATELSDGSSELSTKLTDGTDEVPNPNAADRDQVSNIIGDPVAIDRTDQAKASVYGEGLAPFFMTLAIFIGAFMLIQLMRPITARALASNASNWKIAIGGWLPFFFISIIQGTILYLVVIFGLGLNTAHPWMTWGLFLLASMAFTAIIQGICALAGTPGKMVVLVLMVLQLVSSGGTFPWETTPKILHIAHQWLPMGHVVTGLRHLMYGADLTVLGPVVAGLIGYTVLGLLASTLAVRLHKTWSLKTLHPELSA
ncbi:YhgE/Pip domain-containing protein [Paeniglutamicibacter terrestris]|uniref:YhgE/Pip domain-containing protein n=1 Tax=Paeniglutamicibacter terrestris TaxID=2723403 RepID=A0ABX1GAL4_9MICC|nr:YhgE/Pip domain-containing protein [Paeniglutamicibacter terrestris]NKG22650.1 YhgE/Pip domain-containing protein [Paeniglutamicibacter terrestris]